MYEFPMKNRIESITHFAQYKLAKDIVLADIKKEISLKELADKIGVERTHPYFYIILSSLMDRNIVVHTKSYGTTKIVKINNKKLIEFIYDSDFFNQEFVDFVKFVNPLWNI